ncbi:CD0519/CD1768 family membrane protein [Proteinivorax tanatarense]
MANPFKIIKNNKSSQQKLESKKKVSDSAISMETFVFLFILIGFFGYLASEMGLGIMFTVFMETAHALLIDTVFLIMAIAVLAGALSALLSEFGVVELINKIISPIMKPLYGMPGAASIGGVTTYLSDNPAIISLAKDKKFIKYFYKYQVPALCNLGTAFGMGLVLTTYMISFGNEFIAPAIIGNIGALIGSVVSVRIMLTFTQKYYDADYEDIEKKEFNENFEEAIDDTEDIDFIPDNPPKTDNYFERVLNSILEGGKNGVEMGLGIIPGVLIICTIVMILTFGPAGMEDGVAVYKGEAFEGVALLPKLGSYIHPILQPLFGFENVEAIAFPIVSLGAVGAAMGLIQNFLENNLITPNDIAVFTAMGMCWSGYLSTHVGMMDVLNLRKLSSKAIISHTFGGLAAGISANYLYKLFELIFL